MKNKYGFIETKYSFSESLQAFLIFKERGIEAAERVYPDYKDFVLDHADKDYIEVKLMLIKEQNDACATQQK
jgi:hypothetical protein